MTERLAVRAPGTPSLVSLAWLSGHPPWASAWHPGEGPLFFGSVVYPSLAKDSLQSPHRMLRRASVRGDTRITAGGEHEHTALM